MAVKITILVKKLDTVSTEHFHKYWSESHPSIFLSSVAKKHLLKYSQYHIDSPTTSAARSASGVFTPVEYDGAAQFWVESLDDLGAVFQDPEYAEHVVPDEKSFLDRDRAVLLVGHEEVKWNQGKDS